MASRDLLSQFRGLTLDNVGTWPMGPRVALWLLVIAAFGIGGWFGLWSGQKERLEQLQAEEQSVQPVPAAQPRPASSWPQGRLPRGHRHPDAAASAPPAAVACVPVWASA